MSIINKYVDNVITQCIICYYLSIVPSFRKTIVFLSEGTLPKHSVIEVRRHSCKGGGRATLNKEPHKEEKKHQHNEIGHPHGEKLQMAPHNEKKAHHTEKIALFIFQGGGRLSTYPCSPPCITTT